jgi:hypothetical protein
LLSWQPRWCSSIAVWIRSSDWEATSCSVLHCADC